MKSENTAKRLKVDTLNGKGKIVTGWGEHNYSGDLVVTGAFSGKLDVTGCLTIDRDASITGVIRSGNLIVLGKLNGAARVAEKAVFGSDSFFTGVLTASEAEFHKGCLISGQKNVSRTTEKYSEKEAVKKPKNPNPASKNSLSIFTEQINDEAPDSSGPLG